MKGLTATLAPGKQGKSLDCRFIKKCSEMVKLKESYGRGDPDESLIDQYYELCSCGGFGCSLRDFYLEQASQRRK